MRTLTRQAVAGIATATILAVGYGVATADGSAAGPDSVQTIAHIAQPRAGAGNAAGAPARPDSVYVPITSCRIVSTRAAGGPIGRGHTRSFAVVGSTGFAGQGGTSGGCHIPVSATAITARVTAYHGVSAGALSVFATGAATPHTTVYYPRSAYVASPVTVPLAAGDGKVLSVRDTGGPAQLVIDVQGYYDEQIEGLINSSGTVRAGSNHIVSATVTGTGSYVVTVDRDVTNCTPMVDVYDAGNYAYGSAYTLSADTITVSTWYFDLTTHTEVGHSFWFYLTVTC